MPALAIYLFALCLLLGGGYQALNWIASPATTSVAINAKQKLKPATSLGSSDNPSDRSIESQTDVSVAEPTPSMAEEDIDRRSLVETTGVVTSQNRTQPNAEFALHPQIQFNREALVKAGRSAGKPDHTRRRTASKTQSFHTRPTSRFEKRQLALMTLRTIQFPDGRKVTQLIPYRNIGSTLAFGPEE
jgi:hypothetical protein